MAQPTYRATHIPYGLTDSSKRKLINPVFKDDAVFKKYGLETSGESFSLRIGVAPGGGVPMHRHNTYGETFQPDVGEIAVIGGDGKTHLLSKERGDTYTVTPGEWHRFFNPSATEFIYFDGDVRPAHQGFEKMLHIVYGLAADGQCSPDGMPKGLLHSLMVVELGGMGFPGFGGWCLGLFGKVALMIARWTGEEERLLQKYYGRPVTQEDRAKWKLA